MKLVDGILLLAFVGAVSSQDFFSDNPTVFGYHRRIGIPKATAIKKWEEENVAKNMTKIVGGWHVDITQIPYQAGLVIQLNGWLYSVCGGALVSSNRVVTAAHCVDDGEHFPKSFTVVLGSNFVFLDGLRIFTRDAIMHPAWNPREIYCNLALIRISNVTFTNAIQPINVPIPNTDTWFDPHGLSATVSGYGLTSNGGSMPLDQRLSAVNVPVMGINNCSKFYGTWNRPTNLCTSGANGRGACNHDSGGPLAVTINNKNVLIGVVSFGSWNGCTAGEPTVYTRVTSFFTWILYA